MGSRTGLPIPIPTARECLVSSYPTDQRSSPTPLRRPPTPPTGPGGFGPRPTPPTGPGGFGPRPTPPTGPGGFGPRPTPPTGPGGFPAPTPPTGPGGFGPLLIVPPPVSHYPRRGPARTARLLRERSARAPPVGRRHPRWPGGDRQPTGFPTRRAPQPSRWAAC